MYRENRVRFPTLVVLCYIVDQGFLRWYAQARVNEGLTPKLLYCVNFQVTMIDTR